jgi:hypothetical protein
MAGDEDELDRLIRQALMRFGPDAVYQATIRSIGAAAQRRSHLPEDEKRESALKEELLRVLRTH